MPTIPFIGVRISWLMFARKADFARLAVSAWWRACFRAPLKIAPTLALLYD
jgi:hypothetical protein